jgi:hypothetical protein
MNATSATAKSYSFLPKSDSKIVFILVMVCFSWTLACFFHAIGHSFKLPTPPAGLFGDRGRPLTRISDLLVLSPIFESLLLIAVIELLRWAHCPIWAQITAGALALALEHSTSWSPWGFIVAPAFAIEAFSYVYWRPTSRKVAFGMTACIHALHNLIIAIPVIVYAARNA